MAKAQIGVMKKLCDCGCVNAMGRTLQIQKWDFDDSMELCEQVQGRGFGECYNFLWRPIGNDIHFIFQFLASDL
ncbi:hypothetical protein SO802_025835 [Lithocarpus litseifolius]|uniref:Uncharacterized protein n=1 Tax=Lithocarpus litseifolius TaxID=425828 RepID=A0AAW2C1A8_9ROSI